MEARKKMKARTKQRHEGTQTGKAREHVRHVWHEGTQGT